MNGQGPLAASAHSFLGGASFRLDGQEKEAHQDFGWPNPGAAAMDRAAADV